MNVISSTRKPCIADVGKQPITNYRELFSFFQRVAEKPTEELLGRFFWQKRRASRFQRREVVIGDRFRIETQCCFTFEGVMKALFGHEEQKRISIENDAEDPLKHLISQVNLNSASLLFSHEKTSFFAYGFSMQQPASSEECAYGGHSFVVIQYLNEENVVNYHILQSYIEKYPLKKCLREYNRAIRHKKFLGFLNELKKVLSATRWTKEVDDFNQKFFHAREPSLLGLKIEPQIGLEVIWGKRNYTAVSSLKQEFDTFKQSPLFPRFFFGHPCASFLDTSRLYLSSSGRWKRILSVHHSLR